MFPIAKFEIGDILKLKLDTDFVEEGSEGTVIELVEGEYEYLYKVKFEFGEMEVEYDLYDDEVELI